MPRKITYRFELDNGTSWAYDLNFDESNNFIPKEGFGLKEWTRLEFKKCPHCPLKESTSPQCPIARNLDQFVEDTRDTFSIVKTKVVVETPERTYSKSCDMQTGLRSLFGAIMASSGCPHLDWLRPLSRFHLPFSEIDETLFRVLSLQMLDKFFSDESADLKSCLKELGERYRKIEKVNHSFINRIREYCKADADKNALAALDVFVQFFPYQMEDKFESLRKYFNK